MGVVCGRFFSIKPSKQCLRRGAVRRDCPKSALRRWAHFQTMMTRVSGLEWKLASDTQTLAATREKWNNPCLTFMLHLPGLSSFGAVRDSSGYLIHWQMPKKYNKWSTEMIYCFDTFCFPFISKWGQRFWANMVSSSNQNRKKMIMATSIKKKQKKT